ncbi:MAG: ABC transporter permease DevC [Leptolyngbya sp. IPPAS B-1204]|uniref:FtsX-like permease family protein n=1 Tax=Leptolyngbya sp. NK1-12 TaxID=2547451 RepID=A0AA96WAZ0_9CYAN|nr:ABC transporter permease DevC [Leptolyngbya sp. NK1-12]MBF2048128.1 FtsX-like permease family protein [Elainella sp. C42_A2020_010]RNJ65234.1 MAG: FtsX-like permease family protein [Leptolyngbya sp. IPPAS B-1204]WNZ21718.1 FtsX-like permease family protein [Leptolyngbya sp. NK1-12]
MIFAIPVAWLQLIHQRVRLFATLAGLAFVVTLLFMQLGFQDALFKSAVRVHQNLAGDLFIISKQYKSLVAQQSFPKSRLYQTLAFDGVADVTPLYFQFGKLRNIETGQKFSIFMFGVDPSKPIFNVPEINQNLDILKLASTALFDRDSRPDFGPIAQRFEEQGEVSLEITPFNSITTANRLEVKGLFTLGASFGVDGNLITNLSTFVNIFADRSTEAIDIGSIHLKPGANIQQVQNNLITHLSQDIRILTRQEFIDFEKQYWNERTPIGFTFRLMVSMGFVVGIGIAYQILYSNISSHIIEYATLKAIGFTNSYLLFVVFQQALLLAIFSYLPGFFTSSRLFNLAKEATRLPINMTLDQSLLVLASIVLMCSVSGVFAVQKLRSADPADIF